MKVWRRIKRSNPSDVASCAEVMRSLQSYLDGEVKDELSARRIAAHLEVCRRCGMEAKTFQELKAALRSTEGSVDPRTIERLQDFARSLGDGEALDA